MKVTIFAIVGGTLWTISKELEMKRVKLEIKEQIKTI